MSVHSEPAAKPEKEYGHIVSTPDICGGRPRIDGTRVPVSIIATRFYHFGESIEEILASYSYLNFAKIFAALAYYEDHKDEIERQVKEDEEFAERFAREHPELVSRPDDHG